MKRGEREVSAPNPSPQVRLKNKPGIDVAAECLTCGEPFVRRIYASHVARGVKPRYCSSRCAGSGHSARQPLANGRQRIRAPEHPLADPSGRLLVYRKVLFDAIGPGEHPCHWCGTAVTWQVREGAGHARGALAVDHLDHDSHNHARENLVPACNRCNTLRGLIQAWHEDTGLPVSRLGVGLLQADA